MRTPRSLLLRIGAAAPVLLLTGISECGSTGTPASEDWTRDIVTTELLVDVSSLEGRATIEVVPSASSTGLTLEADGLSIQSVLLDDGTALDWKRDSADGSIDIGLPASATTVVIDYTFRQQAGYTFEGYMPSGDSFIWPYFCGNLFPCHSDPADGLRFSVEVTGLETGQTAVVAHELLPMDAPSYMLGVTVGNYSRIELGATAAGTNVVFYALDTDDPADVSYGTARFRDYVNELERWFGPYPFGPETGAKTVIWCAAGGCEYAGMEEHPYWDVSDGSVKDRTVYPHESAHAWFGDGIRLNCWGEDIVLSEGSASYMEISIRGYVEGESAANEAVAYYEEWLAQLHRTGQDIVVWPQTCDEVDIFDLYNGAVYARGALFWYAVEGEVGRDALMGAFAAFVDQHLGGLASMGQLLDTVYAETGFDPYPLAEVWLESTQIPASVAAIAAAGYAPTKPAKWGDATGL